MKHAMRLYLTGSVQSLFFRQFIKQNANIHNVKGFLRKLEDGRMEIFMEGDSQDVLTFAQICREGPKHAIIRNVEEKVEKFQGFKDFKILNI